jgi:hypothetical protein
MWSAIGFTLSSTIPKARIISSTFLSGIGVIPLEKLPLTKGKIHFIRMVDNDGKISVLNEAFKVGKVFISEYVWATICMKTQTLEVFYRAKDQDTAVLINLNTS